MNHEYSYYEGYVMVHGLAVEHSFLVNDGIVIDPTLAIGDRLASEYLGIKIPVDYVRKQGFETEEYGPYLIDYVFGKRSKDD